MANFSYHPQTDVSSPDPIPTQTHVYSVLLSENTNPSCRPCSLKPYLKSPVKNHHLQEALRMSSIRCDPHPLTYFLSHTLTWHPGQG